MTAAARTQPQSAIFVFFVIFMGMTIDDDLSIGKIFRKLVFIMDNEKICIQ